MNRYLLLPRSSVKGISWPAILPPPASALLALQFQFEQTQWWSAADILQQQFHQIGPLLTHAAETVPFYQMHFKAAWYDPIRDEAGPEIWSRLPFMSRPGK